MHSIGNCHVLEEIGSGGMATVYRAVQQSLGRTVAIKELKPSIAADSVFAHRFEREAHFMASLQHENILHVHDFVKHGDSMCIIMEYVQGIDLFDLLERTQCLEVEVAAIVALQVARALDYAHFRGIVHRDVKPANIMISRQGEVKLMDFGIARDDTMRDLTETGTGLGTPSYMSPEQILGDKLDFRSDVFSLGIVLYQMVTGQKPFVEDDAHTVMQKIRLDRYTSARRTNPVVPHSLERIMARCMEKSPANRYGSTQALIDDLVEFLASRVPINHNAHVVIYLRELGVVGEAEAAAILDTAGPRSGRMGSSDRRMLPNVAFVMLALLVGVLISGGVIQAASGRFNSQDEQVVVEPGGMLTEEQSGFVQLHVTPWADVFVDGQRVATTPLARRLALPPGLRYFELTNPHFENRTFEVQVRRGETTQLSFELKRPAVQPRKRP